MRISSQSDSPAPLSTIDYLLIGHLSEDKTPEGKALGGTISYSGLTAHALGHSVGITTAAAESVDLEPLRELVLSIKPSPQTTSFQNVYTSEGRKQTLHSRAEELSAEDVPSEWWDTELVHIAPLIGELSIDILQPSRDSFVVSTPQGLMRESDADGQIRSLPWEAAEALMRASNAVVLGIDDLDGNEGAASAVAALSPVTAITYGAQGVRVWAEGEWRSFPAPPVEEIDATGAGDIFAAAFFSRIYTTDDPWAAAEVAVELASISVTRSGLASAPSASEVQALLEQEAP